VSVQRSPDGNVRKNIVTDIRLSLAMSPYDRVLPLITGEIKPVGITLEYQGCPGGTSGMFYDQLKFHRYDISEFSFSSFLIARAKEFPYGLLPIFHNRCFSYTSILIRKGAGIRQDHPEDLKGKRFAIHDYQQTAALWIRGVLQREFEVKPEDLVWHQTRGKNLSHGGASGNRLPANIRLHYATMGYSELLLRGEVDAALHWGSTERSSIDRSEVDLGGNSEFMPLFSDPKAEAIRYFKKNRIFPPHHITMVRESIVNENPWIATSLIEAFERAKQLAIQRLREYPPTLLIFADQYIKEAERVFGPDPFPYGVKVNRNAVDMIQTMSVEQGFTDRKQPLSELIPAEVLVAEECLAE
jgi:4,5-dihydroxyphthalate decarboxylase